jgi:DNA replication protein DnaC
MSPKEIEQFKADSFNKTEGNRHEEDGYDCRLCRNKGYIIEIRPYYNGWQQVQVNCKCVDIRNSILRMKKSGLKNIIKDYTFDKFEASEPWQQTIKNAAQEYAKHPEGWFFLGGQSGAGKTHLCTAICRELLLSGKRVKYMLWRDEVVKLKGAVTESDEYTKLIDEYKNTEVLYIDDLFKTGKVDNAFQKPTTGDINVAFEIINYRYNNPALLTIISSELSQDELIDIDEAIGGRIYEKATAFSIGKNRERNYRIKKVGVV